MSGRIFPIRDFAFGVNPQLGPDRSLQRLPLVAPLHRSFSSKSISRILRQARMAFPVSLHPPLVVLRLLSGFFGRPERGFPDSSSSVVGLAGTGPLVPAFFSRDAYEFLLHGPWCYLGSGSYRGTGLC